MPEAAAGAAPAPAKKPVWLWILLGCGGLLLVAVLAVGVLIYFAISASRGMATRVKCSNNLRQVGIACQMYAVDNNDRFPPSLEALVPKYIENARVLRCPGSSGANYVYLKGRRPAMSGKTILAYGPAGSHGSGGFNVLFVDAHVEAWAGSRRAELEAAAARQEADIKKAQKGKSP